MIDPSVEFYTAYLGIQTELDSLKKNRSGRFKYADLDYLMDNLRPILQKHQMVVLPYTCTWDTGTSRGTTLRTGLFHTSTGQGIETSIPLRAFESEEYDDQMAGKNISYQRRYSLMTLLNITLEDDPSDDNGHGMQEKRVYKSNTTNDSSSGRVIDYSKVQSLRSLLSGFANGAVIEKNILAFNKVASLDALKEDQYVRVLTYIKENAVKQTDIE